MKVYISVDMEGVAAIATLDQIVRGGHGYSRAQQLMTAEANAAIAGAFDAGATTVIVNDSHGTMDNLLHSDLDPRARVVVGAPKAQCMAEGLTDDCDAAIFVGYHGAAGTEGLLAHTFSIQFGRVSINGRDLSEADFNALYAAAHGVPVAFLSGDDVICAAVGEYLPSARLLTVKTAGGWSGADSISPAESCRLIREEVAASLADVGSLRLPVVPAELELEIELGHPSAADLVCRIPGAARVNATTVRYTLDSIEELMGLITVMYTLTGSAAVMRQALVMRR